MLINIVAVHNYDQYIYITKKLSFRFFFQVSMVNPVGMEEALWADLETLDFLELMASQGSQDSTVNQENQDPMALQVHRENQVAQAQWVPVVGLVTDVRVQRVMMVYQAVQAVQGQRAITEPLVVQACRDEEAMTVYQVNQDFQG